MFVLGTSVLNDRCIFTGTMGFREIFFRVRFMNGENEMIEGVLEFSILQKGIAKKLMSTRFTCRDMRKPKKSQAIK